MDELPRAVCLAHLCPALPLADRIRHLAGVSRRWRTLALESLHFEPIVDLTWSHRRMALEHMIELITAPTTGASVPTRIHGVQIYTWNLESSLLTKLFTHFQLTHLEIALKGYGVHGLTELQWCPGLTHLAIECDGLSDKALVAIARSCRRLTTIRIVGRQDVTDLGVLAIIATNPELRDVDISKNFKLTDRVVVALAHRPLRRLVIDGCLSITTRALLVLFRRTARHLRSLSFTNCCMVRGKDLAILRGGTLCLEHLNIATCRFLGDRGLVRLLSANASTLETLGARDLDGLNRSSFQAIASCTSLRSLDLGYVQSLGNSDLELIVRGCKALTILQLGHCVDIDDGGARAIAAALPGLETLSLEFCFQVTDAGIAAIVTGCPRLIDINIKALNQLTTVAIDCLIARPPSLRPLRQVHIGEIAEFSWMLTQTCRLCERYPHANVNWA